MATKRVGEGDETLLLQLPADDPKSKIENPKSVGFGWQTGTTALVATLFPAWAELTSKI